MCLLPLAAKSPRTSWKNTAATTRRATTIVARSARTSAPKSRRKLPRRPACPPTRRYAESLQTTTGVGSRSARKSSGETCNTTYTYKTDKVYKPYCEKKCANVCCTVKATCKKVEKVKYTKSCVVLKCEKEAVEGDSVKPSDQVSKKEIFVSETKPVCNVVDAKY